jgi:hypothetical protein
MRAHLDYTRGGLVSTLLPARRVLHESIRSTESTPTREPSGKRITKWTKKRHFIHMTEDRTRTITPTVARPAGDEATAAVQDEGAPSPEYIDMLPQQCMRIHSWGTVAPLQTAWTLASDTQQRRQGRDLRQSGKAQLYRAASRVPLRGRVIWLLGGVCCAFPEAAGGDCHVAGPCLHSEVKRQFPI